MGLATSTVPSAAPPIVTSSAGWISTASLPFSIRKPPITAPKTTRMPTIEIICLCPFSGAVAR